MPLYRSQFHRLLSLDERIRAGKYPNCTSFAREWEVNEKTIQRDIEFLRDSRGAPLVYDAAHKGFAYADGNGASRAGQSESWQLVVAGGGGRASRRADAAQRSAISSTARRSAGEDASIRSTCTRFSFPTIRCARWCRRSGGR
jgi:hypothetical protein